MLDYMLLPGVLRTEIHPTLDRVTVVGNVDSTPLIEKLAKIGKIAEVMKPPSEGEKKHDSGGDKKDSAQRKCKEACTETNDKMVSKVGAKGINGSNGNGNATGDCEDTNTSMAICYHKAHHPMAVHMQLPYYPANPLSCGHYYAMPPAPRRFPPVLQPQPSLFDEALFSDDNTIGCQVM